MKIQTIPCGLIYTNTYFAYDLGDNKCIIVDPAVYLDKLAEHIASEGLELAYIILTHGHGDHIGGVNGFKKRFPKCRLVAAADEAELLSDIDMNYSKEYVRGGVSLEADIWVRDGDRLLAGDTEFIFYMTPGHTKGGMCIYSEKDKTLFSGDTLFCASVGRTDLYGGSFQELQQSIKGKLYSLPDDTRVLPGHDAETTIGFEKKHNPFV